jgi:hypothetical protein
VRAKGIICRNILNLSLHQPQALSAPPLLTIAFPYRSVSAGSAVATDNENDSLCLKSGFPLRVRWKTRPNLRKLGNSSVVDAWSAGALRGQGAQVA